MQRLVEMCVLSRMSMSRALQGVVRQAAGVAEYPPQVDGDAAERDLELVLARRIAGQLLLELLALLLGGVVRRVLRLAVRSLLLPLSPSLVQGVDLLLYDLREFVAIFGDGSSADPFGL